MRMGRWTQAALIAALVVFAAPAAATAQVEPRVVGGGDATIAQYPWQAALVYDAAKVPGNPFQRQLCGGSLMTPSIVMTAAHCVYDTDPDDGSALDPDDVDVILGQSQLSTAPAASQLAVQSVTYQADFDPNFGPGDWEIPDHDIAYLVLADPYPTAATIDIAGPDESALWDPESFEEVTGWGATAEFGSGSGGSNTLKMASVPIIADAACTTDYGVYFNSEAMVCAGYPEGGIDTCFGDSGGPMQAPLEGGGYRLVGITSWGDGCARPDSPGVYTRIAGTSLSTAAASDISNLETAFDLEQETVTGSGGVPRAGGPPNPGENPSGEKTSEGVPGATGPVKASSDPFAKCRRVLSKVKRKRCVKKIRRRLQSS
jgi:trypsin